MTTTPTTDAVRVTNRINGCKCRVTRCGALSVKFVEVQLGPHEWRTLETVSLPEMRHPRSCQCKTCGHLSTDVGAGHECPSCAIDRQAEAAAALERAGIPLGWGWHKDDGAARYRVEAIREQAHVSRGKGFAKRTHLGSRKRKARRDT